MNSIAEWTGGETRKLARVAIGKGNDDAVGSQMSDARERICGEAGLGLFAVADDGEPVCSRRVIVSLSAAVYSASRSSRGMAPDWNPESP